MEKKEALTVEELLTLKSQISAMQLAGSQAQLAKTAQQLEEAKYGNLLMTFRLKYGLTDKDSVDFNTGVITRRVEKLILEKGEVEGQTAGRC